MGDLSCKTALITGCTSGIGLETAKALASRCKYCKRITCKLGWEVLAAAGQTCQACVLLASSTQVRSQIQGGGQPSYLEHAIM
eukprot:1159229-Pelagomonas_calceolata.AAC.1